MAHAEQLNFLIDSAAKIAGSDYKLAKLLEQPNTVISDWRHQRRTCSPEDQAILAHIAGFDPAQVLARAMVQKHEGTAKGDRLLKALGKLLPATGEALGTFGAKAGVIALTFFSAMVFNPTPAQASSVKAKFKCPVFSQVEMSDFDG